MRLRRLLVSADRILIAAESPVQLYEDGMQPAGDAASDVLLQALATEAHAQGN